MKRNALLGFGAAILLAALFNGERAGIYVLETRSDHYVFWIGPVGTTLPYVLLTLVASLGLARRSSVKPIAWGFIAACTAMTVATLLITSMPRHPELMRSSTIAIAMVLTPAEYLVVSGLIYRQIVSAAWWDRPKRGHRT